MKKEPTVDYGATDRNIWAKLLNGDFSSYTEYMPDISGSRANVNLTYDLNAYKPEFMSGVNIDANYDRNYFFKDNVTNAVSAQPKLLLRTNVPYSSDDGKLSANVGASFADGYKPYFYGNMNYRLTDINSPHNLSISANANNAEKPMYRINYSYAY